MKFIDKGVGFELNHGLRIFPRKIFFHGRLGSVADRFEEEDGSQSQIDVLKNVLNCGF